jgi:hypothetical protein
MALLILAACSPGGASPSPTATPTAQTGLGGKSSAVAPRDVESLQFMMPSGNLGCHIDVEFVRCDILKKSWEAPPQPADCELDWGQSLSVGAEEAGFSCAGDTVLGPDEETLAYGSSVQAGDFICESSSANVRCWNDATGHGFTLARERYEIF